MDDDLDLYLNRMTEQQQLKFRLWAIKVALKRVHNWHNRSIIRRRLEPLLAAVGFIPATKPAMMSVRRWLDTPNSATQTCVSLLAESFENDQALWAVMLAVGETNIHQLPGYLTRVFGWTTNAQQDAAFAGDVMYRGMLRAAKIIAADKTR